MKNYYDILGITKSASEREIKSAFRELAKKTHPDKNPNTREKFIEIFEAYHILINNTENTIKVNTTTEFPKSIDAIRVSKPIMNTLNPQNKKTSKDRIKTNCSIENTPR